MAYVGGGDFSWSMWFVDLRIEREFIPPQAVFI
jgi:hypothetical protein